MDIERHLGQEPVVARPPSQVYRIHKFIRRNRVMATSVTVVVTVLVLGVVASAWQAIRATRAEREQSQLRQQAQRAQANEARERQKAEAEATKSRQVAQFLKDMLKGVGPSVALGRDTTLLKEILDKTVERIGLDLTNQPEVEIDLRLTLADTYRDSGFYQRSEMRSALFAFCSARRHCQAMPATPQSRTEAHAASAQAKAGLRRHQRHTLAGALMGRARMGSSRRKRCNSSASSFAEA